MHAFHALLALFATALVAPAQRVLHRHALPLSHSVYQAMRPAGDTNGDGREDFVAVVSDPSGPGSASYYAIVASGVDGSPLHTLVGLTTAYDAVGLGDVDLDGHSDVAVVSNNPSLLQVYSGSSGALLYSVPPPNGGIVSVADIGDWNGDGRADVAIMTYNSGTSYVRMLQGQNGAPLPVTLAPVTSYREEGTLRNIGDINQDGKADLAVRTKLADITVIQTAPVAVQLSLPNIGGNREMRTADLDGDGIAELLVHTSGTQSNGTRGRIDVTDAMTGNVRLTLHATPGLTTNLNVEIAPIGDLDSDGTVDLVATVNTPGGVGLRAFSGSNGRELWAMDSNSLIGLGAPFCTIGDLDGDGLDDLAVQGSVRVGEEGWLLLSGRITADVKFQSGACGGGPFFPRLGMTRPVIGSPVTIVGDDGPVATNGLLLLSWRPPSPTYLGASSCVAWFDHGNSAILLLLSAPQWSFSVTLPNLPQLAGFEIALQSCYAPTGGPLGFDLSNGLWARIGYP